MNLSRLKQIAKAIFRQDLTKLMDKRANPNTEKMKIEILYRQGSSNVLVTESLLNELIDNILIEQMQFEVRITMPS